MIKKGTDKHINNIPENPSLCNMQNKEYTLQNYSSSMGSTIKLTEKIPQKKQKINT